MQNGRVEHMAKVQVRYIVHDVDTAVPFTANISGFVRLCIQHLRLPCSSEATFVLY